MNHWMTYCWQISIFIIKVFLLSKIFFSKATTRHCVSKFDKVDALLNLFFVLFKSQAPSHHSYINFMTSSMDHENRFTRRLKRRMRRCARSCFCQALARSTSRRSEFHSLWEAPPRVFPWLRVCWKFHYFHSKRF